MKSIILFSLLLSSTVFGTPDARTIAQKMLDREDGKSSYSYVILLSCGFHVVDGKKTCKSPPRKKVFESLSKDVGKNLKDTKALSMIIEPPAEFGVGFL